LIEIDRKSFYEYLKTLYPDYEAKKTIISDSFYIQNNPDIGINDYEILSGKIELDSPNIYNKLFEYIKSQKRKKEKPQAGAKSYIKALKTRANFLDYRSGRLPKYPNIEYKPRNKKITFSMIKQVFITWKNIHNGDIRKFEGIEEIHHLTGMNESTAKNYLYHLDCFYTGDKQYSTEMKPADTQYFLSQIFNDFGKEFYQNALSALKIHIDYLKNKNKNNLLLEQLYNDFSNEKKDIKKIVLSYKNINNYLNDEYYPIDNKQKNINTSTKKNGLNLSKPKIYERPYEITQRAKDIIILINDICENYNKEPIFINDSETLKLWRAIEKLCTSEEIFINFTLNLYILIYETTRKENPEYTKNNGKPYYNYHLPLKFIKNGTPSKHFMDTVGALRHKFAHKKPEYNNVPIKKIEYKDVLKEILNSKTPKSSEDFQILQFEILKRLDNALEILLNIIEKEKNPRNP